MNKGLNAHHPGPKTIVDIRPPATRERRDPRLVSLSRRVSEEIFGGVQVEREYDPEYPDAETWDFEGNDEAVFITKWAASIHGPLRFADSDAHIGALCRWIEAQNYRLYMERKEVTANLTGDADVRRYWAVGGSKAGVLLDPRANAETLQESLCLLALKINDAQNELQKGGQPS